MRRILRELAVPCPWGREF